MRKLVLLFAALLLVWAGCDGSMRNLPLNPYDPESVLYIGNPVSGAHIEASGKNMVKLAWVDSCAAETGFEIKRLNLADSSVMFFYTGPNENFLTDNTLDTQYAYKYLIGAKTAGKLFHYTDTIGIKYALVELVNAMQSGFLLLNVSGDGKRLFSYYLDGYNVFDDSKGWYSYKSTTAKFDINERIIINYSGKVVITKRGAGIFCNDIDNNKSILLKGDEGVNFTACNVSADGRYVAAMTDLFQAYLWDLTKPDSMYSKKWQAPFSYVYPVTRLKITPDNKMLVCETQNTTMATLLTGDGTSYSWSLTGRVFFKGNDALIAMYDGWGKQLTLLDVFHSNVVSTLNFPVPVNLKNIEYVNGAENLLVQAAEGVFSFNVHDGAPDPGSIRQILPSSTNINADNSIGENGVFAHFDDKEGYRALRYVGHIEKWDTIPKAQLRGKK